MQRQESPTNELGMGPGKPQNRKLMLHPHDSDMTGNEISRSLRWFAMSAAFNNESVQLQPYIAIDDIMRDFACNGYFSDELSSFDDKRNMVTQQQTIYQQSTNLPPTNNIRSSVLRMLHMNAAVNAKQEFQTEHCVFCQNNKEPRVVVQSHSVRDSFGRVLCPKLRIYICPICGASGDMAHTVKYCPQKTIFTMKDTIKTQALSSNSTMYCTYQMTNYKKTAQVPF